MHVLAIRRPGQRGTLKLLEQYGKQPVCVRYRYDARAGKRYKTAEVIIDETDWRPSDNTNESLKKTGIDDLNDLSGSEINQPTVKPASAHRPPPHVVWVKIFFRENQLREQVRAAGGRWSKTDRLWQLPYETAISLGLKHRIAKQ